MIIDIDIDIFTISKVGAMQSFAVNASVLRLLDQIRATCNQDVLFPPKYSEKYSVTTAVMQKTSDFGHDLVNRCVRFYIRMIVL